MNPSLTAAEVRQVVEGTADKVDPRGGRYDARGHSPFYGYGRVNAARAVLEARARREVRNRRRAGASHPRHRLRMSRASPGSWGGV